MKSQILRRLRGSPRVKNSQRVTRTVNPYIDVGAGPCTPDAPEGVPVKCEPYRAARVGSL